MISTPALELRSVSMQFGGVAALDSVSMSVAAGEVHALLGQNGCGKSTLVKILSGYHTPEAASQLYVDGEPVSLPMPPGRSRQLGLSFVFQDLGLVHGLTVLENLTAGTLASGSGRNPIYLDDRGDRKRWSAALDSYGVHLDLKSLVRDLPPVQRAMLAIVRAAEELRIARQSGSVKSGILVLDEPTVFLPRAQLGFLFDLIRRVVRDGASVIFISHDLPAVHELAQTATVLRDGRVVHSGSLADLSSDGLVELITGKKTLRTEAIASTDSHAESDVVLDVVDLTGPSLDGLSLSIRSGECVGVAGLLGSGIDELPAAIFGASPPVAGSVAVNGTRWAAENGSPWRSINVGVGLVPADRRQDGGMLGLPVTDNLFVLTLGQYFTGGVIRRRQMRTRAAELITRFFIKLRDPESDFGALSGGNQQKVVLAKWLEVQPSVLILHEPTQGVDIGAREEIYRIVRAAQETGMAVLWVSTDLDELARVSDRVLVLSRGRVASEIRRTQLSKERLAEDLYSAAARA